MSPPDSRPEYVGGPRLCARLRIRSGQARHLARSTRFSRVDLKFAPTSKLYLHESCCILEHESQIGHYWSNLGDTFLLVGLWSPTASSSIGAFLLRGPAPLLSAAVPLILFAAPFVLFIVSGLLPSAALRMS